jgi:hypothetical protein
MRLEHSIAYFADSLFFPMITPESDKKLFPPRCIRTDISRLLRFYQKP